MPVCNFCDRAFDNSQIDEGNLKAIGDRFLCYKCLDDLKKVLDLHDIDYYTWNKDEIKDIASGETERILIEKGLI